MVRDHYEKLGFAHAGGDERHTRWRLDVVRFKAPSLPFTVKRVVEVADTGLEKEQEVGVL